MLLPAGDICYNWVKKNGASGTYLEEDEPEFPGRKTCTGCGILLNHIMIYMHVELISCGEGELVLESCKKGCFYKQLKCAVICAS
jgi:hypothetical protein